MPAKTIIILEKAEGGRYRYALWADVPVARQSFYAEASKVSAWKGASASENAALAAGSVVERVDILAVDNLTVPQAQAALIAIQASFQAQVNAYNPWLRYGSFYDGSTWTAGGIP